MRKIAWDRIVAPELVRNSIGILGVMFVAYGARLVYLPAGYVVLGLCLVVYAIADARAAEP